MAYSIRVTPPDGLGPSLEAFDNAVRGSMPPSGLQRAPHCGSVAPSNTLHSVWWARALQRGPAQCRRLRCVFVGYCATVKDMDPGYDPDFNAALNLVNMALPPADHLPVPAPQPVRQQELSRALDRVVVARLAAPAPGREALSGASSALAARRRGGVAPCSPKRRLGASRGDPALSDHGSLAAPLAGV